MKRLHNTVQHLPRGYRFLKNLPANLRVIRSSLRNLDEQLQANSKKLSETTMLFEKTLQATSKDVEIIKQRQADFASTVASLPTTKQKVKNGQVVLPSNDLQAENHALDGYYVAFENKFRGSEDEIYKRLQESYTELLTKTLPTNLKKLPIIDIGCGRGELLRLLKDLGLSGVGIDLNKAMVDKCKANGYKAQQEDALVYLRKQPSSSLAAVGGIHIVEHIPFGQLFMLLQECFRVVAPGGFVFFETPNAENIVVGSLTFWYDSSHLKPIPPAALAFILEYVGFGETKIMRMHPDRVFPQSAGNDINQEIAAKIFGSRDYTAVGIKARV